MHPQICDFSSREFYDGKLQTGVHVADRPLSKSMFLWPSKDGRAISRCVFIPCAENEDMGRKSKSNKAQAHLCRYLVKQLQTEPEDGVGLSLSITILTPYTRQAELLRRMIPSVPVSSIDAFQGREADIIIFVTVRSNVHNELGFLKDMRRLNVALTRAKSGLIVIGDKVTLTMGNDDSAKVWSRLVEACAVVQMDVDENGEPVHD
jgi:superfamily I DNA and/or RNA helicase